MMGPLIVELGGARIKLELKLPQPNTVCVGLEEDKLEYENLPKYCEHCKKNGT